MIVSSKALLTPTEAAYLLFDEDTPTARNRTYRLLKKGLLDKVADQNNLPIIKDGKRYHIPRALILKIRGDTT